MHLFLTNVLPLLAHNHPSAVAFLTCRHNNFHASIIPEFLSDEERVKSFCGARQQNQLAARRADENIKINTQFKNLYSLFTRTPLMQFSPSLVLHRGYSAESILKPLLETKYFIRSLQRCLFCPGVDEINTDRLRGLSKVRSLTNLDLGIMAVRNQHLEIIINSFPSLETLAISRASNLKIAHPKTAISVASPPPPATKTMRSLTLDKVDPVFATQFVPNFPNLRQIALTAQNLDQGLDLLPLSSSLPLLTDLSLTKFTLKNSESLKNLVHLSSAEFSVCELTDSLSFLTQDALPHLTTLRIDDCDGLSTSSSFASLAHAPNLHLLQVIFQDFFDNDCLQDLENMIHLRSLDLGFCSISGHRESFKTLMRNLFQLEELNLQCCHGIGGQGAIAGALYSTHSRLRVLNFSYCHLIDDDLKGIGSLKNSLEVLDLAGNDELTNETVNHCKDLVKLKVLKLERAGVSDLSPLKDCLNIEELDVGRCTELTDASFRVFSEEPNSFPNLSVLSMFNCEKLTEKVLQHLLRNNHLVYQLKNLCVQGLSEILPSSESARKGICQLKGLRRLTGFLSGVKSESGRKKLEGELMRSLKNLEEV